LLNFIKLNSTSTPYTICIYIYRLACVDHCYYLQ